MISLRKDKDVADEFPSVITAMLPRSKTPVQETDPSRVQALPMYAQVDKAKKTSNKGGPAQVRVKDNETFALMATWSFLENH